MQVFSISIVLFYFLVLVLFYFLVFESYRMPYRCFGKGVMSKIIREIFDV